MTARHLRSMASGRIPPKRVTRSYLSRLMDECQMRWKEAVTGDDDESMVAYKDARELVEQEITRLVRQKCAEAVLYDRANRSDGLEAIERQRERLRGRVELLDAIWGGTDE